MRVGLAGASYGAAMHAPAYRLLPESELVAVCTAHRESAERAAAELGLSRFYTDVAALAQDPEVDLVDVATRPRLHRAMVLPALRAGKHVLSEAPLALDSAEGEELVNAAEGLIAVVDMQSRYVPALEHMRNLVREGFVGEVEAVTASAVYPTFTLPERALSALWCAEAANGASSLRVHGLHTADLVEWMVSPIAAVSGIAALRRQTWPGPQGRIRATSHDHSAVAFRLLSGAIGTLQTSWVAWHGPGWRLDLQGGEGRLLATAAGHTPHFPVTLAGARADDAELRRLEPPEDLFDVPELERDAAFYPFARLVRRLALAVAGEGPAPGPGFQQGLRMLRLAEAVEASHRESRWIDLGPP